VLTYTIHLQINYICDYSFNLMENLTRILEGFEEC
jgi:hypothetical protein